MNNTPQCATEERLSDLIRIGTTYTDRGKNKCVCEVIEIYSTFNSKGELVRKSYVTQHLFCGQIVTAYEVPAATVLRTLIAF